jgi:uncharacterized membrane protein YbhN (UPF0104 family)
MLEASRKKVSQTTEILTCLILVPLALAILFNIPPHTALSWEITKILGVGAVVLVALAGLSFAWDCWRYALQQREGPSRRLTRIPRRWLQQ